MSSDLDRERAVQLRDGLREERRIYQALAELTNRQEAVIDEGASDEILRLARAKEAELHRISAVEEQLGPLKADWRLLREAIDGGLRGEVEHELDGIEGILRNLIESEQRGQARFASSQKDTSERLRQVEGGRRIQRAYVTDKPAPPARYLDRSE